MGIRLAKALLAILVVALLAALAVFFLHEEKEDVAPARDRPGPVSAQQLSDLASERQRPVYWVGERDGVEYEVTEEPSGSFYVRYLDVGDDRAESLTVATYPFRNAAAALRQSAAGRGGARLSRTPEGAVMLVDPASPESVHLAYPGADLQVEVFSPRPGEARRLASRGAVEQIAG
jgi:hypothetical protein